MATGDGPPPEPVDERLSQIEAAVPYLSERVRNPYDSDRPPSTQPADSVADIITGMTQSNPEDSDDDRTLELSSTEYLYVDSANATSPLPADPTETSSEPAQCRRQASQQTQCTTTQSASQKQRLAGVHFCSRRYPLNWNPGCKRCRMKDAKEPQSTKPE
ncbi:uncharacterized protein LOC142576299 isoform X2 [Dermacentor variabilis]